MQQTVKIAAIKWGKWILLFLLVAVVFEQAIQAYWSNQPDARAAVEVAKASAEVVAIVGEVGEAEVYRWHSGSATQGQEPLGSYQVGVEGSKGVAEVIVRVRENVTDQSQRYFIESVVQP